MKVFIGLFISMFSFNWVFAQEIVTSTILETTQSWDGKLLPEYPKGQPKATILKIVIPPGSKLPEHYHPVLNFAIVTKGTLKVIKADGQEKVINEGEAIAEVINALHYGVNEGNTPVELYVFYAGNTQLPLSVKKKPESQKLNITDVNR